MGTSIIILCSFKRKKAGILLYIKNRRRAGMERPTINPLDQKENLKNKVLKGVLNTNYLASDQRLDYSIKNVQVLHFIKLNSLTLFQNAMIQPN